MIKKYFVRKRRKAGEALKKQRKIIGVILSLADGDYQKKLIEGIELQARAFDYDVLVFSSFIKTGCSEKWQLGEQNIYNMINFSLLDGIIIAPDTMDLGNSAERVIAGIRKEFKGPVVSVEIDVDGFCHIASDSVEPVKKIVSHLIEVHKLTDIAFVTGTKGHPHAEQRLEGYYEALVEHNLPIDSSRVYYGDFWYSCGEPVVEQLLADGRPLPQAIACASDTTAIGIAEALRKKGIRVPEDVAVTGYDSVPAGIHYSPCITSAVIPSQNTGAQAVDYIHSCLNGLNYSDKSHSSVDIAVGQSCGCGIRRGEEADNKNWQDDDLNIDFSSATNNMLEGLLSEDDLNKYLVTLNWYTYQIEPFDTFCLCLCNNWDNLHENEKNTDFIREGYTEHMLYAIEHCNSHGEVRVNTDRFFNLSEMLPAIFYKRNYPSTFFFTPVHFNDRCFGYSVISYGSDIRSYDTSYRFFIRFINNSLESLRRQRQLMLMYRKMRESAILDNMTGIYNRNGFNLYADEIFRSAKENGKKLLVILGDLNSLKYINDNFGHIQGDEAIKAAARVFRTVCGSNKICFRIGGDEFIILDTGEYDSEQIESIKSEIKAALAEEEKKLGSEYPLSVSLGIFYGSVEHAGSIEQPISEADAEMFREKQEFKKKYNIKR